MGLGLAGIGLAQLESVAAPIPDLGITRPFQLPIKLSSNENPYGPSPLARQAILDNLHLSNRYNWEQMSSLVSALAQKHQVLDHNILLGAGSTEIIDVVARLAALKKGNFVTADPSYPYWTDAAEKLGLKKVAVPATSGKGLDLSAMLKAITSRTRLVYICNPNNPSGTICEHTALVQFIRKVPANTLILVDEAYLDFIDQPSLSNLVTEQKNLIIAKTFSKIYGLAGARIGYAVAHQMVIEQLSTYQSWPNGSVSVVSVAAAYASLMDKNFVTDTFQRNQKVRAYTIAQLEALNLRCIPSSTNFIYFSLENYKKDYFEQLKINNILGTRIYEEQGKWTRITVGTMEEMEAFVKAMG